MWEVKSLVDVTDLITCGVAKRPEYVDKGVPFLSAKNVKNGRVIWSDHRYITKDMHQFLTKNNKPMIGDILYTRVGSFGEAAIIEDDFDFSIFVSLTLIKPKHKILNNAFLKYYLNSSNVKSLAKNSVSSSGVGNLNVGSVRKFPVPIPPLEEQKRIVGVLDEAFAGIDRAIANTEKNLQNARDLFESYLNNIFTQKGAGWVDNTLADIAIDFGRGKSKHRPRNDPKLYGGKFPFIQTGDVRNSGHFIKGYSQTYNENGLAQSRLWPKGTLCITIAANIAETGILTFDACFPDSIIGLVVDEKKYSIDFIEYCLQYTKVRLQAAGKGSAQDNINLATFKNWMFSFPNIDEQIKIVEVLNRIDEQSKMLVKTYNKKLTALKELKQSLLQKAFAGELTSDMQEAA